MCAIAVLPGFTPVDSPAAMEMAQMPHHYTQFDVKMGWAVIRGDKETVIKGVIKNIRYDVMEDVEVWVSLVDAQGRLLARETDYIIPRRQNLDDVAPFSFRLPVAAPSDAKLIFTYKYLGCEGEEEACAWMQSFETGVGN
jgi:hypothetical protein